MKVMSLWALQWTIRGHKELIKSPNGWEPRLFETAESAEQERDEIFASENPEVVEVEIKVEENK